MNITHVNPDSMHKNPYFSQAVLVEGGRTLYIGEQNGVDADGAIVPGGTGAQTAAAYGQIRKILAEVGGDQTNVVRLVIYLAPDASLQEGLAASGEAWGDHPTAITVVHVAALGRPDALIGIEAVAVV
jgi:enamine deaminase RidA (YjgF/YER057c/UK114 family)